MPGYPQYQNKVWKWDFRPEGGRSSTRKGWRLYAYVANPAGSEPVEATAFLCYDKPNDPGGNYAKMVAEALKDFLAASIVERGRTDERFRRQAGESGTAVSLCLKCFRVIGITANLEEIERLESMHTCQ